MERANLRDFALVLAPFKTSVIVAVFTEHLI